MNRTFLTGATGFIGSHLVEALLARGDSVTALFRPTSDLRRLTPLFSKYPDRLRLVLGDLRDPASLAPALAGVNLVFHLAAVLMPTDPRDFRDANVDGTRNLVRALKQSNPAALRRFLFVSSLAAAGPAPTGQTRVETDTPAPISVYGESKRDAEQVVRAELGAALPFTIVRPSAVYGPRERDFSGGTFPLVSAGLLPRVGFARRTASFVEVRELVRGILLAADSPASVGKTYFLSDPATYDANTVIATVADALKQRVRIPAPVPAFFLSLGAFASSWAHLFTRDRPALTCDKVREVRATNWACSAAAAERDFGWVSKTTLADGMRDAVNDWKERDLAERRGDGEPLGDRARKTYALGVLIGVMIESSAYLARWYTFDPWWLILVTIVVGFGGVVGTIALVGRTWPALLVFAVGTAIGAGAELANALWFHSWSFNPESFGRIPGPWFRSLLLGSAVGVLPLLVNGVMRHLYRRRMRLG